MIEELKQLLTLVEKMPSMVLWTLLGFAIFKIVIYLSTTGSIVFILKLVIERWYEWATKLPEPKRVNMEDIWITHTGAYERFKSLLHSRIRKGSAYLHNDDVLWIEKAIEEKLQREQK